MSSLKIKAVTNNKGRYPDYATGALNLAGRTISSPVTATVDPSTAAAVAQTGVSAATVQNNVGSGIMPSPSYQGSEGNEGVLNLWASSLANLSGNAKVVLKPVITDILTILVYADQFGFDISAWTVVPSQSVNVWNPPVGAFNEGAFLAWVQGNFPDIAAQITADRKLADQQEITDWSSFLTAERKQANAQVIGIITGLAKIAGVIPPTSAVSQPIPPVVAPSSTAGSSILIYLVIIIVIFFLIAK